VSDDYWKAYPDWIGPVRARFRAFGEELQERFPSARWDGGDLAAREPFLVEVFDAIAAKMAIQAELVLAITIHSDPNNARGYTDHQGIGVVTIPRVDLESAAAWQIVGAVTHELRHAWQRDVITGRAQAPLGDDQVAVFRESEETDHQVLENDCDDAAAEMIAGYGGEA
jgi:hypothetical protein